MKRKKLCALCASAVNLVFRVCLRLHGAGICRRQPRLRIKLLLDLATSALLLCVFPPPSAGADKVRVAYSATAPTQGVLWVAEVSGLLNRNGIGAELIYTRAAIEALVAGEVEFGQMTGSLMSSAKLQGADPVMIAGVQDTLDDRVVARPHIKSMEDLKGKRIGVFRFGSASHLRLIYVLPRYGLSERDVTLLQIGDSPERLIALAGGSIDATLFSPPDHLRISSTVFSLNPRSNAIALLGFPAITCWST